MEKAIQAMREQRLFDYVSNNYYNMSKNELADIIKELDYAVNSVVLKSEYAQIMEYASNELEDLYTE